MTTVSLYSRNERLDIAIAAREFFWMFFNCLAVLAVAYFFIKDFGYTSLQEYEKLLPFHKPFSHRTNSIFVYISSCLTVFISGLFLNIFFKRYIAPREEVCLIDSIISVLSLAVIGNMPQGGLAFVFLLCRYAASVMISLSLPQIRDSYFLRTLDVLSFALFAAWLSAFFYKYLSPEIFYRFGWSSFVGFILLGAILIFPYACQGRLPRHLKLLIDAAVISVLIVLVFKNDFAYFDYSIVLGPVNDVFLGKDILANVVSIYGFFDIYFIASVFKIFNVHDFYVGLSLMISVLYVAGYSAVYFFLRWYTKNIVLSVLFLVMMLEIEFFCLHIPIHWLPQATFLRFGSFLPVFFLLLVMEYFPHKKLLSVLWGAVTAAIFFL